ncbi:hypothetical protein J5X84_21970 [Streptosporangiaceae bacterium NEAU-GS5]|nr:hypothetical protein [Streptosporangiaceae bacterium NEAU-GS5]
MRLDAGRLQRATGVRLNDTSLHQARRSGRIGQAAAIILATLMLIFAGAAKPAHATVPGFRGIQGSNGFVDFNGDGKADGCRLDGVGVLSCTLSTGTGFGTRPSFQGDPGYFSGRGWADFNGDHAADYCRIVGDWPNLMLQCTVSGRDHFGSTFTSGALDAGWDAGRAWADFDGDGKADYCRIVGAATGNKYAQCTISTGDGWDYTIQSPSIDPGYDEGRSWVDVNGDGKADYCRIIGFWTNSVQCTLSNGTGFGRTFTSGAMDAGYGNTRQWGDHNGDGRADYCRVVGDSQFAKARCTVSVGAAFGDTVTSTVLNSGGATGAWADVNGDHTDDFCRDIWGTGTCTLSTPGVGTGFGDTISKVGDGGTAYWADFNGDGLADYCRLNGDVKVSCTVSTGTSFNATYSNF